MRVLCATDFSPAAETAVDVAAALAERLGDALELVHVIEPAGHLAADTAPHGASLMVSLEKLAEQKLKDTAAQLAQRHLAVSWSGLTGLAEETLLAHAAHDDVRLLAVGTHGRKGLARLLVGSVAERLVRRARRPVLVVPTDAGPRSRLSEPAWALRFVAGVESNRGTDAALVWLQQMAHETKCDVSLVHVYDPEREHARLGLGERDESPAGEAAVAAIIERELRPRINEALGGLIAPLELRPTQDGEAGALIESAEEADADVIVVGTNQRGDRRSDAAALTIVRAAHRPVLCVPAEFEAGYLPRTRTRPLRKLLVPVDLRENSRDAVDLAYQMLRGCGGVVELCHVVDPDAHGRGEDTPEVERRLSALVPPQEHHDIMTHTSVLEGSSPATAILQAAERLDIDAIVLAAHRGPTLKGALLGSVAARVIRAARRPVMVVPPSAAV
jgi:nucleotide-binding universal stress UspA family protein